jgi:lipopolysaccharide transport system ATP-binding protein
MPHPAIRVDSLGKRYRIGTERVQHDHIREALAHAARAPLRKLEQWRRRKDPDAPDAGPREIWALRDISFEVQRGEVLGIMGGNGAGKSTLLKILSRIIEPTTGRAEVRGRIGSLLEVGTGFHPELTGRDNIFLNGAMLGMDRHYIRSVFDDIVDFSGVETFLDTPVKRYSSGMYMRLAFAVAAHMEPDVLIVDEVLAVGDADFQEKCLDRMRTVSRDGRTIIFVSHDEESVAALTDRVIHLQHGRIHDPAAIERNGLGLIA